MAQRINRRQALKTTAAAGAGFWLGTSAVSARAEESPNEKMNLAVIGIGGRGRANLDGVAGQNIVALCDVDDERAGDAYKIHPKAKKFYDFRKMLSEMENEIDGVVISTPDHTHFHPAMMAMNMGKPIYCEKPMAHNVWEVREMTNLAREKKLATQLGMQRHAFPNMARIAELIQGGAIGDVTEVYCRIGGKRGMPKIPTDTQQVPSHLKWDLWLGPTEERDYHKAFCPYAWRFWWNYGTGEMGNWGCHVLDIPFRALKLTSPTRVDATGPVAHELTTPQSMRTKFQFPASDGRPPVTLHWMHSENPPQIVQDLKVPTKRMHTLFVGTKGKLLCGFKGLRLLPEDRFVDYKAPESTIPKSPGFYNEWFNACKGGGSATCSFDYSGPLAETVLLGNVAFRSGGFGWNSQELKAVGNNAAQNLLREEYRKGWETV